MRWIIPCAGCGLTVQVGQGQIGRLLRCPSCQVRLAVTPPRPRPVAPAPARPRDRRRLWLAGGAAAAVLTLGVVISVAYAHWSRAGSNQDELGTALPPPMWIARGIAGTGGASRGMFAGLVAEGAEAVAASIGESAETSNRRLPVGDMPGVATLATAGKIPTHLAVVLDPASGRALVATRDGLLRVYDSATWNEWRGRALDRPAYHLQIDSNRRLLYAASSPASALRINELGERVQAGGDVHVYDLDAALSDSGGAIEPIRRFAVSTHITGLALSPDGRHLYFLHEDATACRLGRLDTSAWAADTPISLGGARPSLLAQVPDGRTLYALSGGRVFTIDRAAWAITDQVTVPISVQAMLADDRGRLYLAERARGVQVKVIDIARRMTLARWHAETDGLPSLALSPDSNRVYLGTSAFSSGRVWSLDISNGQIDQPPVLGQAGSDRVRLLRGGLSVTSDGRHLLTGTGQVFRLPS